MDVAIQILVTGLTVGGMYALSAIGLSLVWGALGMLNMAHGVLLTLGGYVAFAAVTYAGAPWPVAVVATMGAGALMGFFIYHGVARVLLRNPEFDTVVIIATVGLATALEHIVLLVFGGQPYGQPVSFQGSLSIRTINVPAQNLAVMVASFLFMMIVAALLSKTRTGRAIRATAQNRELARILGVPVERVYAQVLAISGVLASISGLLLSGITMLSPTLGDDPMLKAFIMCVVAGFGSVPGAAIAAFALALVEQTVAFALGARWGFPLLLLLVIITLILRPQGVLGRVRAIRL